MKNKLHVLLLLFPCLLTLLAAAGCASTPLARPQSESGTSIDTLPTNLAFARIAQDEKLPQIFGSTYLLVLADPGDQDAANAFETGRANLARAVDWFGAALLDARARQLLGEASVQYRQGLMQGKAVARVAGRILIDRGDVIEDAAQRTEALVQSMEAQLKGYLAGKIEQHQSIQPRTPELDAYLAELGRTAAACQEQCRFLKGMVACIRGQKQPFAAHLDRLAKLAVQVFDGDYGHPVLRELCRLFASGDVPTLAQIAALSAEAERPGSVPASAPAAPSRALGGAQAVRVSNSPSDGRQPR